MYNTATSKSLTYNNTRAYLLSALFVLGNIVVPQLCHLIPGGGLVWLPIYLFTFIAACRFGLFIGLTTAIASPLVNFALFGMPAAAALPAILFKSVLLAVAASFVTSKTKKISLLALVAIAAFYQGGGFIFELAQTSSLQMALSDIIIGWPGILAQIIITYLFLNFSKKQQ